MEIDVLFHKLLRLVQDRNPSVISDDFKIEEKYSVFWSLKRGAISESQNAGIPQDVINANNRWRTYYCLKGINPNLSMIEHYSDSDVLAPTLIKFLEFGVTILGRILRVYEWIFNGIFVLLTDSVLLELKYYDMCYNCTID